MSDIHMTIIKITIFIRQVCFYILLFIFKILWCTISTTLMDFITAMIIYIFVLFSIIFTFSFFLTYYRSTSDDKMSLWNFLYDYVHNHDHYGNLAELVGRLSWFFIKELIILFSHKKTWNIFRIFVKFFFTILLL